MTVYIDYIFIENLIMNYLLLYQTTLFSKKKASKKNIFISSILGTIYVCVMYIIKLDILNYSIAKILLSFVMVYVCFGIKEIKIYIKLIGIFYIVSVINVGTYIIIALMLNVSLTSAHIKIAAYIIGSFFVWCIKSQMWKMFKIDLKKENLVYDVYVPSNGKYIAYKGFVDTGNTAKHLETGRMIFFANQKSLNLGGAKTVTINTRTINNVEKLKGYMIDNVIIKKEGKVKLADIVICFSKEKIENKLGCDMIMNFEIYEDLLGGIHI